MGYGYIGVPRQSSTWGALPVVRFQNMLLSSNIWQLLDVSNTNQGLNPMMTMMMMMVMMMMTVKYRRHHACTCPPVYSCVYLELVHTWLGT